MLPSDGAILKQDVRRGMLVSEWLPQAYDGEHVAFRQLPQGTLLLFFAALDHLRDCRCPARVECRTGLR